MTPIEIFNSKLECLRIILKIKENKCLNLDDLIEETDKLFKELCKL